MGCSKGSVVFLEKEHMDRIYLRVSYHREKVIFLDSLYHPESGKSFLVSMCEENILKVISFDDEKCTCLHSFNC